ncbi:MAG TPA: flagellar biosynthetic protein FliR, partial [Gammaproteobacteria bacterium]|nr:flagellar biosynthetic protein FliR [Gammaproteobacteria bacterium]
AIILAGQSIAGGMGLGMANMVDPNLGNVPTVSQFLLIICLLVFLSLGGHLILLTILSDSFTYIPIA